MMNKRKQSRGVTFLILVHFLEDLKIINRSSIKDEYSIEEVRAFIRRHNLRQAPPHETE